MRLNTPDENFNFMLYSIIIKLLAYDIRKKTFHYLSWNDVIETEQPNVTLFLDLTTVQKNKTYSDSPYQTSVENAWVYRNSYFWTKTMF